jgi:hypothetical protein
MRTAIILAVILAAGSARADEVGVVVSGEASLQPELAAGVETWLRDHGRTVVPSPMPPEAISTLLDCFVIEDQGCARGVLEERSKTATLVYARIDVTPRPDGTRDLALVAYWMRKGHEPTTERRTCSGCSDDLMRDTVATVLGALAEEPEAAPSSPPPQREVRSLTLPLGLMTAGAVAVCAGAVLIAMNQDPPPKTGEQPPSYRTTMTGGAVLTAVGLAAAGTGVYLWLHERASSAPVAAVGPSGGYIGWAGRF